MRPRAESRVKRRPAVQMLGPCSDRTTPPEATSNASQVTETGLSAALQEPHRLIPFLSYHLWLEKKQRTCLCMLDNWPVSLSSCTLSAALISELEKIVSCFVSSTIYGAHQEPREVKVLIIMELSSVWRHHRLPLGPWVPPQVNPFMISSYPQHGPKSSLFVMHITDSLSYTQGWNINLPFYRF